MSTPDSPFTPTGSEPDQGSRPPAAAGATTTGAAASGPAVSAVSLTKTYGRGDTVVTALNGVSVGFEQGRFTAIMGPSGSGKSTLMHCLAGLDAATSGQVWLGDTDITHLKDKQLTKLRRDRIGFVFQAFNLVPTLTAKQNMLLPLQLANRKPDTAWLDYIVGVLGIGQRLGHKPHELSGGQQQRVAIARALLSRPAVIFGDEPTGNLDSTSGAEVLALLRRSVRELDQTVVMVTHDPTAASYADRVVLLADGAIAGDLESPGEDAIVEALRDLGRTDAEVSAR